MVVVKVRSVLTTILRGNSSVTCDGIRGKILGKIVDREEILLRWKFGVWLWRVNGKMHVAAVILWQLPSTRRVIINPWQLPSTRRLIINPWGCGIGSACGA
eukprot:8064673-Pyramimonas_sp.AAC.1